ncbi:MAG TPA: hypothetical protein VFH67_03285 [bacterium]|nr:hypothetical protein [bacterium]
MERQQDSRYGFTITRPSAWVRVEEGQSAVRFVPPGHAERSTSAPEFVLVQTSPSGGILNDGDIRRAVFSLLSVHGVSGFQQDARTSPQVLWYKFEVTGATEGTEWASVGLVASGPRRYQVAVCAKPLDRWRDGQKQCDEIIRSFQPGNLSE